jgi:sec-independent protein translocase protein TatB
VFGLGFGELLVVIIVGIVVVGPRDLPRLMRQLGQWAAKARRMASDLRAQSGIDDVLREGDLRRDIEEIRKLARGELDVLRRDIDVRPVYQGVGGIPALAQLGTGSADLSTFGDAPALTVERDREFPKDGADSLGALPDTALVYDGSFPPSKWADDPLYMRGEEP